MDKRDLKENRVHGSPMFPLNIYYMNSVSGDMILDCHWHDEMEFLLVTEGEAMFQIEAAYYEVHAGEAIFVNSGELHAGYQINNSSCSYRAFVFNPNILFSNNYDILQEKYFDPLIKKDYFIPPHIKGIYLWEKSVLSLISQIIEKCNAKPEAYEIFIKASLFNIFAEIFSNNKISYSANANEKDNYKLERLKTVLSYIYNNYNKKITINELAALINMSEGHFCRFFKQMMRKTPIEYLNYYRICEARKALHSSDKKISLIAMDAGFDNFGYFISMFKRYVNYTPSEYKKLNKKT